MDLLVLAVRQREDARIEVKLLDADDHTLATASSDEAVSENEFDDVRESVAQQRDITEAIPMRALKLGRWLFPGDVRKVWQERSQNRRVRTALDIDAKLKDIPWELARLQERLFLNSQLPFLRSANGAAAPAPVAPWPLDVLVVLGTTDQDLVAIGGDHELRAIREALRPYNRAVHVRVLRRPDRDQIKSAIGQRPGSLTSIRPHILHFIGHGSEDGLALHSSNGYVTWTSQAIRTDLNDAGFTPPLVYLNACRSTGRDRNGEGFEPLEGGHFAPLAQAFFDKGARAVVSMHADIEGKLAGKCAESFYRSLAEGKPVDVAVASGRAAVDRAEPNEAGLRERRDAYLPVLLVSGSPDTVLPDIADLAPQPANVQIDPASNLQRIVRELVNHDDSRRTTLCKVLHDSNVLVVHGVPEIGKSWLLGWCIDGWLRRKVRVCYVPMFVYKEWMEVVRAILTGERALGVISAPLPKARAAFESGFRATKSGKPVWPRQSTLDPEQVLTGFHEALAKEAVDGELVLVLDQFGSPAGSMNKVAFDALWQRWIERHVMGGTGRIRVVLGLSSDDITRFAIDINTVANVPLSRIASEQFHPLLEELLKARRPADYEKWKSRIDRVVKQLKPSEVTPKQLSKKCDAVLELAEQLE